MQDNENLTPHQREIVEATRVLDSWIPCLVIHAIALHVAHQAIEATLKYFPGVPVTEVYAQAVRAFKDTLDAEFAKNSDEVVEDAYQARKMVDEVNQIKAMTPEQFDEALQRAIDGA